MGKIFRFLVLLSCLFNFRSARCDEIVPDWQIPPRKNLPPASSDDDPFEKLHERKRARQHRQKTDSQSQVEETHFKELSEEVRAKKGFQYMMQVSLVYPKIFVSSPRSNYRLEPASHFSMFVNMSDPPEETPEQPLDSSKKMFLLGWRFAGFSGTGIYKSIPMRFGYTYFGPIVGVASLEEKSDEVRDRSAVHTTEDVHPTSIPILQGWLLYGGISLYSRFTKVDSSTTIHQGDLQTTVGSKVDGTGLWAEVARVQIFYKAIGVHYVFGVQNGEKKWFTWAGVALGGWM